MSRRFTSAQFVPANAGAKAKNPVGSTLFSTPMVALLRHPGHKILRTCCRESARKRLRPLLAGPLLGQAQRRLLCRLWLGNPGPTPLLLVVPRGGKRPTPPPDPPP